MVMKLVELLKLNGDCVVGKRIFLTGLVLIVLGAVLIGVGNISRPAFEFVEPNVVSRFVLNPLAITNMTGEIQNATIIYTGYTNNFTGSTLPVQVVVETVVYPYRHALYAGSVLVLAGASLVVVGLLRKRVNPPPELIR
jgi:hypothetical protein